MFYVIFVYDFLYSLERCGHGLDQRRDVTDELGDVDYVTRHVTYQLEDSDRQYLQRVRRHVFRLKTRLQQY